MKKGYCRAEVKNLHNTYAQCARKGTHQGYCWFHSMKKQAIRKAAQIKEGEKDGN